MTARLKKLLFITVGAVALFILAAAVILFFTDTNTYKPLAEAAVSDALGMDFRIRGKMNIVLFPGFGMSVRDVTIRNRDMDFVSAEKLTIGLKLIPLIKREVRINEFKITKPKLVIERDKSGRFNFERPAKMPEKDKGFPAELLTVERLTITNGEISYFDKISGASRELKDFDLTISALSLKGQKKADFSKNISFQGEFSSKGFKTKDLEIKNLGFKMKGRDGIFDISHLSMNIFGGDGEGSIEIDSTRDAPLIKVQFTASKFGFEKFTETISRKKIMSGKTNFSINITMEGKTLDEMKRRMNGESTLKGENLLLYSFNIDSLLSKLEKSQTFSLVDVGAFFLMGPLGTTLTKGYDFAALYKETGGGQCTIKKLISKWKIRNGVAEAEDVALTTEKNRVALKGKLDFINKQYKGIVMAVLDPQGCLKFSQKIEGPFNNPKVEKVSAAETVAGPVLKLFEKAKKFIEGDKCKPFYEGSLKHPV